MIELICPILLALGLVTRLAAALLLALSLVIQIEYRPLNEHLYWAALFGWYVMMGAGPLSLDRLLGRGLADSALPLAGSLYRAYGTVTRTLGPAYQLCLRGWLAAVLFTARTATAAFTGD